MPCNIEPHSATAMTGVLYNAVQTFRVLERLQSRRHVNMTFALLASDLAKGI